MPRRLFVVAVLFGSTIAISGCGEKPPEMGLVEGVVRVKGKPYERLVVTFFPESAAAGKETSITASGETDAQGKYQLKHYFQGKEGLGTPTGWNRVMVEDLRQSHLGQGQARPPQLFSFDYSGPSSTPLRKEVKPGPQTIDLEL